VGQDYRDDAEASGQNHNQHQHQTGDHFSEGGPQHEDRTSRGQAASIEGKWWTSGNDFGASEIIFTQNGSMVTGEIHYADGRTGTLTGTMVGKRLTEYLDQFAGESGSGWLELSWNNFLGGPWKNQKVRDGSWTMMRIEGKWCLGGSRRTRSHRHPQRTRRGVEHN
jgi:hypothetical protein